MSQSYKKIDYRIRPAKYAERLMMCDAFRKLKFGAVENYQYIGLGSVYFSDFALFHRLLGLTHMISIEDADLEEEQRFRDNLPYANIDFRLGNTKELLPALDLNPRSIVWLDYDGRLESSMLEDIRSVVLRASSGSVLCVSVQCNGDRFDPEKPTKNVDELVRKLGAARVPHGLADTDLLGWQTGELFRKIISDEIGALLAQRNGGLPVGHHFQFSQIFNFQYADGARMLTVGGVLFDEGQRQVFDSCGFGALPFVRSGTESFRIEMPKLTSRELRLLDRQMPLGGGRMLELGSIPEEEAQQFRDIYRYFPNVVFSDL